MSSIRRTILRGMEKKSATTQGEGNRKSRRTKPKKNDK